MKKLALFILAFIINLQLFAQEKIGVPYTKSRIDTEFSIDKLYNKKTGEKLSKKEFEQLIKNNLNFSLESVYDNNGNTVKYLYNPDLPNSSYSKSIVSTIKLGDYYPKLIFKTVDGKTIRLEDLIGKMVILRYELESDSFRFKKHEIEEIDQSINETNRQSEIVSIIIFNATKQQIKNSYNPTNSHFQLIPNGSNFHRKLNINSLPYTVILDKQGRLLEELRMSAGIDILELLNRS